MLEMGRGMLLQKALEQVQEMANCHLQEQEKASQEQELELPSRELEQALEQGLELAFRTEMGREKEWA